MSNVITLEATLSHIKRYNLVDGEAIKNMPVEILAKVRSYIKSSFQTVHSGKHTLTGSKVSKLTR